MGHPVDSLSKQEIGARLHRFVRKKKRGGGHMIVPLVETAFPSLGYSKLWGCLRRIHELEPDVRHGLGCFSALRAWDRIVKKRQWICGNDAAVFRYMLTHIYDQKTGELLKQSTMDLQLRLIHPGQQFDHIQLKFYMTLGIRRPAASHLGR
jgi:hypothetical protein